MLPALSTTISSTFFEQQVLMLATRVMLSALGPTTEVLRVLLPWHRVTQTMPVPLIPTVRLVS
jgi:hypothetical protein